MCIGVLPVLRPRALFRVGVAGEIETAIVEGEEGTIATVGCAIFNSRVSVLREAWRTPGTIHSGKMTSK